MDASFGPLGGWGNHGIEICDLEIAGDMQIVQTACGRSCECRASVKHDWQGPFALRDQQWFPLSQIGGRQ